MSSNNITENKAHTLYLCYFGLREPLVQTQVLPYLRQIKLEGIKITLLTFETNPKQTWSEQEIATEKNKLANEGIDWHFLTYHKRPSVPATIYDILSGAFFAWKLIRKENVNVLHGKVHVPTLMGALAKKFSFKKPKLLFDIRGFFPEEYTDGGTWTENGWLYHVVKRIEKWILKESDGFVVLTKKARDILFPESEETGFDKLGRPVEVIPCCVDLSRFKGITKETRAAMRREHNLENRQVITYVGSLGTWYMADEMTDFMETVRKQNPSTYALILTQSSPEIITKLLAQKGFTSQDYLVKRVSPTDLPYFLSGVDIALSFIKACYSKLASSPTKVAEYLACGIPVVANSGVGDIDEQMENNSCGAIIKHFNQESYLEALQEINAVDRTVMSENCKSSAKTLFDLEEVAGVRYRRLYRRILQK